MNKTYIRLIIMVLLILLTACSPSTSQIQSSIARTQAAWTPIPTYTPTPTFTPVPTDKPVPTETLVPLSELNIDDILVKTGDLPSGYSAAQILDTTIVGSETNLEQVKTITQTFEKNGGMGGFVTVLLFDNTDNINNAFAIILRGMGIQSAPSDLLDIDIGSKAAVYSSFILSSSIEVAFIECNAVVHIRFSGMYNENSATAYAKRLDSRLKERVCR